jgi:hypothetical protein
LVAFKTKDTLITGVNPLTAFTYGGVGAGQRGSTTILNSVTGTNAAMGGGYGAAGVIRTNTGNAVQQQHVVLMQQQRASGMAAQAYSSAKYV